MGILDSFKKAMGSKAGTEADEIKDAASEPAPATAGEEATQADPPLGARPEAVPGEPGSYTVQSGDTLWSIAETVYGDGSMFSKIFDANTDLLEQPDRIFPGQKLLIPDLDD